ncbi:MAG: hypothetical protein AAFS12_07160 [Cyanobacteria bacterium J06632_19]
MERIVRLNAVENLWPAGILGMNQHSLHPKERLFPQKLKISGVNFIFLAFLNALNTINANSLFTLKIAPSTLRFLGVLLRALLNKSWEVVSSLVLWVSMNFVMISASKRRAKEIRQITCFFRKTKVWVVKVSNPMEPKFLIDTRRHEVKKYFYDNTAVSPINWSFSWLLTIFNEESKVKIPLTLLTGRVCLLMHEKAASTYEDTQFRE